MSNCLNCGKELHHVEGRRPKKYCDNNCRQKYFQKITKGKEPKYVQYKTYNGVLEELKELKEKYTSGSFNKEDLSASIGNLKHEKAPKTYQPSLDHTNAHETMPEGLHWKEQLEWKRNHKK